MKTLGNHGLAYLLEKGSAVSGTAGALVKGTWYYAKAKASALQLVAAPCM